VKTFASEILKRVTVQTPYRPVSGAAKQTPAQRDARTTATENATSAVLDYAEANPPDNAVWLKTWNSEGDSCDECAALDGETIDADALFDGDLDGPPYHPNCNCSIDLTEHYSSFAEQALAA
jgi:hypothetical protein